MAQLRIRIDHRDLADLFAKGNVELQMQMTKPPVVEVWDASEGDSRPLLTLEEGDYLEVVFE